MVRSNRVTLLLVGATVVVLAATAGLTAWTVGHGGQSVPETLSTAPLESGQTMQSWAAQNLHVLGEARDSHNAAQDAIIMYGPAGLAEFSDRLAMAGSELMDIRTSPDGGRTSDLIHQAGQQYLAASGSVDDGDYGLAADQLDTGDRLLIESVRVATAS